MSDADRRERARLERELARHGGDDDRAAALADYRLDQVESLARSFAPTVGTVAVHGATLEALADDVDELKTTSREFRVETRKAFKDQTEAVALEFKTLRAELRDDRKESRNRTLLALGPIAAAALAIFAKVVLGIDLPGA